MKVFEKTGVNEELAKQALASDQLRQDANGTKKLEGFYSDFLDEHYYHFLKEEPFWGRLSLAVDRIRYDALPAPIMMGFDKERDRFVMVYNGYLIQKFEYSRKEIMGMIIHAHMHLIQHNMDADRFDDYKKEYPQEWGLATDLANNALIEDSFIPYNWPRPGRILTSRKLSKEEVKAAPSDLTHALHDWNTYQRSAPTKELAETYFYHILSRNGLREAANLLFSEGQAENYALPNDNFGMNAIDPNLDLENANPLDIVSEGSHGNRFLGVGTDFMTPYQIPPPKMSGNQGQNGEGDNGDQEGEGNGEGNGDQEGQGNGEGNGDQEGQGQNNGNGGMPNGVISLNQMADQMGSAINAKQAKRIRGAIEQAKQNALEKKNWGVGTAGTIEQFFETLEDNTLDWKTILNKFVASAKKNTGQSTYRRLNRHNPYLLPGNKKDMIPKILFAYDQSGSVSNHEFQRIVSVVRAAFGKCLIYSLGYDYEADPDSFQEWKKNTIPKRTQAGGTCFDAPSRWLTETAEGRRVYKKLDGVINLTDGGAPFPQIPMRIPRLWIVTPQGTTHYLEDQGEPIIQLTDLDLQIMDD